MSSSSPPRPLKHIRHSASSRGLDQIGTSIRLLAENFIASASATEDQPSTPQRRKKAVRSFLSDGYGFTSDQNISIIRVFEKDIATADTYLAIEEKELRLKYIQSTLPNL
jgi:hypothetical protein